MAGPGCRSALGAPEAGVGIATDAGWDIPDGDLRADPRAARGHRVRPVVLTRHGAVRTTGGGRVPGLRRIRGSVGGVGRRGVPGAQVPAGPGTRGSFPLRP